MKLINRIALFLILVGVLLVALFVLSDIARMTDFRFILFGGLCILVGIFINITNPVEPSQPSGRFSALKKKRKEKKDRQFQIFAAYFK